MLRSACITILVLSTLRLCAQDSAYIEFAQVVDGKQARYIDRAGRYLFDRQTTVQGFCSPEELIVAERGGKVGFIDIHSHTVLPFIYDAADCFKHGYARVLVGGKWGFIDRRGNYLVTPSYDFAGNFLREGLAGVVNDGKLGFVDTTGALAIPIRYRWYSSIAVYPQYPFFNNGLIAVVDGDNRAQLEMGKLGFMNTRGELAIPAVYDPPFGISFPLFVKGRAEVYRNGEKIMIDTLGREVDLDVRGTEEYAFADDTLAVIHAEYGYAGLINQRGDTLLPPMYNGIERFSEGFAAVQIESIKDGVISAFIDRTGKFVFGRKFGFIRGFHEGFAAVQIGRKWGYIDTMGRTVIEPRFDYGSDFIDGRAVVSIIKGRYLLEGMIDTSGAYTIKPEFQRIGTFTFGLAPAQTTGRSSFLGGKWGYIDERGRWVIKPKFTLAGSFERESIQKK